MSTAPAPPPASPAGSGAGAAAGAAAGVASADGVSARRPMAPPRVFKGSGGPEIAGGADWAYAHDGISGGVGPSPSSSSWRKLRRSVRGLARARPDAAHEPDPPADAGAAKRRSGAPEAPRATG